MKRILSILAIAALPGVASAQALNEPFTYSTTGVFPPTGWTATNTNAPGAGGEWVEAFNTLYTFPNLLVQDAAAHDYEYLSGITCDDTLDSPSINLSTYGSPELTFVSDVSWVAWMAHYLPTPNSNGASNIFISTDGGTTFGPAVWSETTQFNGVINETVDLSGVAANQAAVVVRFHYYGYDAHTWAIDDVIVDNVGPVGPSIALGGTCPGPMTVNASGMTAGGPVAFGYGSAGTTILPGGACAGATVPLAPGATQLGILSADGSGNATLAGNAPPVACGNILVVAFDVATCTATNTAMP